MTACIKKQTEFKLNTASETWLVCSPQFHQKHEQWYGCCLEV